MRVFVTGTAGFIGFHLARRLLADGHQVVGYDGMTQFYDDGLKLARLAKLGAAPGFVSITAMLEDKERLDAEIAAFRPELIVHLAAQAGVRYSVEHPEVYVSSNLVGTFNLLEAARAHPPAHLLIASTSSVYGGNQVSPSNEMMLADYPVSLYAATKKATEGMSHSYAHLYGVPTTCFRFFTVYGPWGRPDMALFKFVAAMEQGRPIEVYGGGNMRRDFTYIDDLIEAIVRLTGLPPVRGAPVRFAEGQDSLSPVAPWRVVNIGGERPAKLLDFIRIIERWLGRPAEKLLRGMQAGDVTETHAAAGLLKALTGYVPSTSLEQGVRQFVEWYRDFYSAAPVPADGEEIAGAMAAMPGGVERPADTRHAEGGGFR